MAGMKKIYSRPYRAERSDERSEERSRSATFSKKPLIIVVIAGLILTACASATPPTAIPTVSLDNNNSSSNNQSTGDANSISASAVVVPVKEARLSFSSVGIVKSVNVNVGDKVTAGEALVQIDTAILEARVREAEANLEAAQAQVRYLKRAKTNAVHLETAQADVDRAQALVDSAKAALLAQSTLSAPFDGTIVSVDISPAETVTPGLIVIVLGDLTHYQIETTDLSERNITRVHTGQPATVFIKALNKEFAGKVSGISLTSSMLGGDVVFKVTIEINDQPQELLWGMSADVKIQAGE